MSDYLTQRNGIYYYFRRVPADFAEFDKRPHIRISLKTKDEKKARRDAGIYNEQIETFWQSLIDTSRTFENSGGDYKRAVSLARLHGFSYKSIDDIARGPLREVVERINVAHNLPPSSASAILGTVKHPQLPLSDCFEKYLPLCVDRNQGKSDHQMRKWRVPRELAINNFISVVGDKSIEKIVRKDALTFRSWLMKRMDDEGLNADTANKQMNRVRDILKTVAHSNDIDIDYDAVFSKLNLKLIARSRPPFEASYVQNVLLKPGTLDKLNDDAKYLIYAFADTGARESELVGLQPEDILLDAPIPFIWIRPRAEKRLKTVNAERQIPLVGSALYAFQKMPQGFGRYTSADSASTWINRFLTEHNLRPTPQHSLYSLRHTFKDRLRDAGAPEEVIDGLMGHEGSRPKYGRGHILQTKLDWMQKIAFKVG